MNKPSQAFIREIFSVARQIDCPRRRSQYIASMCDDPHQRDYLQRMLEADQAQPRSLEQLAGQLGSLTRTFSQPDGQAQNEWNQEITRADRSLHAWDPTGGTSRIGPYQILKILGEGGIAVVYHARQTHPLSRDVSLKVVKPGMDSRQVLDRFELERDVLQRINHPGIASILDAGMTVSGHPYIALEYIDGRTIDEHCREFDVPLSLRLKWFCQICQAVHHAHHVGIIHRDLKPSNVMISQTGDQASVKVIDFGVAKAITSSFDGAETTVNQLIGTPAYMSPEQAGGDSNQIDTRTDVYSLGALLYALIAGYPPVAEPYVGDRAQTSRNLSQHDQLSTRPSRRLAQQAVLDSKIAQASHGGSGAKQTSDDGGLDEEVSEAPRKSALAIPVAPDAFECMHRIRYELDWIVLKAIQEDPDHRYDSPLLLAEDVQRFLDGRPVTAKGPSWIYLSRNFISRHQIILAAAALTAILLVGFGGAAYWNGFRLVLAERRAVTQTRVTSQMLEREKEVSEQLANAQQATTDHLEAATLQQMLQAAREDDYAKLGEYQLPTLANGRFLGESDSGVTNASIQRGNHFSLRRLLTRLGTPRPEVEIQHPAEVHDIDLMPDAKVVATACEDGLVRLWDLESQRLLQKLGPHDAAMRSVAISPDGQRIVSGDAMGNVRLWDPDSGQLLTSLSQWNSTVETIEWSRDGERIIAAYRYGPVLFLSRNGDVLQQFNVDIDGHARNESFLLSADGKQLITSAKDFGYQLWDTASGELIRETQSDTAYPRAMAWLGDQRERFVAGNVVGDMQILEDDLEFVEQRGIQPDYPQAFVSSPDGRLLWIANRNGSITCTFVARDGDHQQAVTKQVFRFQAHDVTRGSATDVQLIDDFTLVSSGDDGRLCVWNVASLYPHRHTTTDRTIKFARSKYGATYFVSQQVKDEVFRVLRYHASDRLHLAFPNEKTFPSSLAPPRLSEVLTEPMELTRVPAHYGGNQWIAFSPDTHIVGVIKPPTIEFFDSKDGSTLLRLDKAAAQKHLSLFADNRSFGFCNEQNQYSIWTADYGASSAKLKTHFASSFKSAVMVDASATVVGINRTSVDERSTVDGRLLRRWDDRDYISFAVSLDDRWIALCGDGVLEIRDRSSGESLRQFLVRSMAEQMYFCDQSRILLTVHRDATVQAWHLPTGSRLGIVMGGDREIIPKFDYIDMQLVGNGQHGIVTIASRDGKNADAADLSYFGVEGSNE